MNRQLTALQPAIYECRWLNYVDVMDCDDLQARVVGDLGVEDLRLYFYPRDAAFRDQVLAQRDYIVGCFDNDRLIGQFVFLTNHSIEQAGQNFMLDIALPDALANMRTGTITNAMVDPDYRGAGVMSAALDFLDQQLPQLNLQASYFITHITNHAMIVSGLRSGYRIIDAGVCSNNNEPMYLMVNDGRAVGRSRRGLSEPVAARIEGQPLSVLQDYFRQGYVATDCVPRDGLLMLQKTV